MSIKSLGLGAHLCGKQVIIRFRSNGSSTTAESIRGSSEPGSGLGGLGGAGGESKGQSHLGRLVAGRGICREGTRGWITCEPNGT